MTNECPMTNDQARVSSGCDRHPSWNLVIGTWSFVGHWSLVVGHSVLLSATVFAADLAPEGFEFFEKRVRPVLVERCYKCHSASAEKLKGQLHLDSREGLLQGGESGKPAIAPGEPENSRTPRR